MKKRFVSEPLKPGQAYLYIALAPSGLRKIGMTRKDPRYRMYDLKHCNSNLEAGDFTLEFSIPCYQAGYAEKAAHSALKDHRIKNRSPLAQPPEFFKIDLETAIAVLRDAVVLGASQQEMFDRFGSIRPVPPVIQSRHG